MRRLLFRFAGTGKSSQSQKSCRDAEIFVFAMGGLSQQVDFTMGGLSQRMDIAKRGGTATGQIAQTCVFSAAARAATSRATDRTKRPRALPDRVGWQPVCRGVCCGLDGAAPWALFHQTERRLWVLSQREEGAVGLASSEGVERRFRRWQRSWPQGGSLMQKSCTGIGALGWP